MNSLVLETIDPFDKFLAKEEIIDIQKLFSNSSFNSSLWKIEESIDLTIYTKKYQTLTDKIQGEATKFSISDLIEFAYQLISGLSVIHNHSYLHGLITSNNIEFLSQDKCSLNGIFLKNTNYLPDFSMKRYLAPELIIDGKITKNTDIFSLGITILELIIMKFCVNNTVIEVDHGKRTLLNSLLSIINSMIHTTPIKRPLTKELLEKINSLRKRMYIILSDDLWIYVSSFLFLKNGLEMTLLNKDFHKLFHSNPVWKNYLKYTYYDKNCDYTHYGAKSYLEMMKLHYKIIVKSKDVKVKNQKIEFININEKDEKLLCYLELPEHAKKSLVRIQYITSKVFSHIGIVSKETLNELLSEKKGNDIQYIKMFCDGSIGGAQMNYKQIFNSESVERAKLINGKFQRMYYKLEKNDILTIHLDSDSKVISFYVNDDPSTVVRVTNVGELKKNPPYFIILKGFHQQTWKILSNLNPNFLFDN